jgi:dihydroorotate dehydrogenase (fumarate)
MDTSTRYLGLELKNPIIAGSSGMTSSVAKVKALEAQGAGAVVLKSIFEEEVALAYADFVKSSPKDVGGQAYFEYEGRISPAEYYQYVLREENLKKYVDLVGESKKALSIPVMASINCFLQSVEWLAYAKHLEAAGADALELNMFFPPTDFETEPAATAAFYLDTCAAVTEKLSIPVALKISPYFTDLGPMIQKLSRTGIAGLVLFNRFFSPDIDIEKMELTPGFVFSHPAELALSLRWIAIMANKVDCDLAASTGIHDGEAVIKQILAGAAAVQVASCLYKNGGGHIGVMQKTLESWLASKGCRGLADVRGKLSQERSADPSIYDRTQFMRYFGGKKDQLT